MKRKVALSGGKKEKFLGNSPKRVKKSENHQPDDWKEKGKEAGGDEMNMRRGNQVLLLTDQTAFPQFIPTS